MRTLTGVLSRRLALRRGLTAAIALTATSAPSRKVIAAQGEAMTASGGGVNLKLMPDVEGAPTVPLRESFTFDAHYAQCIIEDNPQPFSMETYAMGKVIIDAHSFFMGMYANEISLVSIRDAGNGTRIGTYQCFGAWTAAADDAVAPIQRLTTVQFLLDDGAIVGLANEAGTIGSFGAVHGGTGRFVGASGTFRQNGLQNPTPGVVPAPGAPGTPGPGQYVLRAVFDLILPQGS